MRTLVNFLAISAICLGAMVQRGYSQDFNDDMMPSRYHGNFRYPYREPIYYRRYDGMGYPYDGRHSYDYLTSRNPDPGSHSLKPPQPTEHHNTPIIYINGKPPSNRRYDDEMDAERLMYDYLTSRNPDRNIHGSSSPNTTPNNNRTVIYHDTTNKFLKTRLNDWSQPKYQTSPSSSLFVPHVKRVLENNRDEKQSCCPEIGVCMNVYLPKPGQIYRMKDNEIIKMSQLLTFDYNMKRDLLNSLIYNGKKEYCVIDEGFCMTIKPITTN